MSPRSTAFLTCALLLTAPQCGPAPDQAETPADSATAPATTQQAAPPSTGPELAGTSWQLVRFEGGDGTVLTPDDRTRYTIAFGTDGRVSVRIDCNRGNGTYTSAAPPQLEFGPLALTRAACPPGSLHDQIVRQWPNVRSYVMRDSHLFLSLMADGGTYEYEPAQPTTTREDT